MSIRRQDDLEQYNITSDWLKDFAKTLEKQSQTVDYLKQYLDTKNQKNKTYASIEEKMADIKARIGFGLIKQTEDSVETKVASDCSCKIQADVSHASCGCDSLSAHASTQHSKADIDRMSNILQYIKDMIKSEPHINSAQVLSRCREDDALRFSDLRIDLGKLQKFIDTEIDKYNKSSDSKIKYQPSEPLNTSDAVDKEADYYRHAEPHHNL